MELHPKLWTLVFCLSIVGWLYVDIFHFNPTYYEVHPFLKQNNTNVYRKPAELLQNFTQILRPQNDYIKRTNAIERLHDLEYNLNLENPHILDQHYRDDQQVRLASWARVTNNTKCSQQLKWISSELSKHSNSNSNSHYALLRGQRGLELTQLVGSIGKPETGAISSGVIAWPGSYRHCKQISMNKEATANDGSFRTRYCWARFRPKWWPKNESVYPATLIRVGTCLPESCNSNSAQANAKEVSEITKFEWPQFYSDNFEFESVFCLPDERSPLRQFPLGSYYYLWLICSWLAFIITTSIVYEITAHKLRHNKFNISTALTAPPPTSEDFEANLRLKLLEALSVHCAIKRFKIHRFRIKYSQMDRHERPRVDLSCFDFVKIFMAIMIVLGHGAYLGSAWFRSLGDRVDLNVAPVATLVLCIGRCVDTFFIFFGVLTSYTIMRKFNTRQLSSPLIWMGINIGVLLRITPVFMLVFWWTKLISPYLSNGPWWDYGLTGTTMRGICLAGGWWKSIPYFGCQGTLSVSACVPPAWFIVSYSQISLILPLVTYIIVKLPNNLCRIMMMAFLTAVSTAQLTFRLATQSSIDGNSFLAYGGFIVNLLEKFQSSGQMSTLSRLGCVSVGCYVGYLLRRYETGQISEWPRWMRSKLSISIVLALSVLVLFLPTLGYLLAQFTGRYPSFQEILIGNIACSMLWPILVSIMIICATSIHNHIVIVRFFSHSFWHVFNKLGLGIYLIHWDVLTFGLASYEQGPSMGFELDVIKLWTFSMFFTILIAFAVHILFESPLSELLVAVGNFALESSKKSTRSEDEDDMTTTNVATDQNNNIANKKAYQYQEKLCISS